MTERGELLVLCYHAVSPTWPAALSVTPEAFERQMHSLARSGWSSRTFTDAVVEPGTGRSVAITFDDAYASVHRLALPILQQVGFTATVFAPTEFITLGQPLVFAGMDHWPHTEYADELEAMSWEELGELAELGWEIGSHTRSHPHLTTVDDAALGSELADSREACRQHLGHPARSVAFPYGDVDDRVVDATRRAGYTAAAGLEWPSARSGPHRWPRVGIYHKDNPARFRAKIGSWARSRLGSKLLARLR